MVKEQQKEMLFDTRFERMIQSKCANLSRHAWPAAAAYVFDPRAVKEKQILECIYADFPECSRKKQIKLDITSLDNHKFWGAWSELRVYDWMSYKGFKLTPEPLLEQGKPDYLVEYPIDTDSRHDLILEVTAVSAESHMKQLEREKVKELLTELDEVAATTNLLFRVSIPIYSKPLPSRLRYDLIKKDFAEQVAKIRKGQNVRAHFLCTGENIRLLVQILGPLANKKGYIGFYTFGLEDEKREIAKFTKRVYDRLLEKFNKYDELDDLKKPFVVAMFVKDIFHIGAFEQALTEILKLEKESSVESCRRLSGILLYETVAILENDGSYTLNYFSTFFSYPNAKYPVDDHFMIMVD